MPPKKQKLVYFETLSFPQQFSDARTKEKQARNEYMALKKEEKDLQKSPNKKNANLKAMQTKVLDSRIKLIEAEREVGRLRRENNEAKRKLIEPVNYEIFKGSTNPDVQVDLFYDILKFLIRNEVEKCQLVSRWWNQNVIADNSTTLPLRPIAELAPMLEQLTRWFCKVGNGEQKILTRELAIHGLRNVVVKKLHVEIIEKAEFQRVLKTLQTVFKNNGRKLECVNASLVFWISDTYKYFEQTIKMTKTILEEYIHTRTLEINYDKHFPHLLQNPSLIEFLAPYEQVVITGDNENMDCECEPLMKFITAGYINLKCRIVPKYYHDVLGVKILERFLAEENVESTFIKSITFKHRYVLRHIVDSERSALESVKNAFISKNANYDADIIINGFTAEIYEISRDDGWKVALKIPNGRKHQLSSFTMEFFKG